MSSRKGGSQAAAAAALLLGGAAPRSVAAPGGPSVPAVVRASVPEAPSLSAETNAPDRAEQGLLSAFDAAVESSSRMRTRSQRKAAGSSDTAVKQEPSVKQELLDEDEFLELPDDLDEDDFPTTAKKAKSHVISPVKKDVTSPVKKEKVKPEPLSAEAIDMMLRGAAAANDAEKKEGVIVNRAPVLALWVAVVAGTQGYPWETAVTIGECITGLFAQTKARSLGLYGPPRRGGDQNAGLLEQAQQNHGPESRVVYVMGQPVSLQNVEGVDCAINWRNNKPITPATAHRYFHKAFDADLLRVQEAMIRLARSIADRNPQELDQVAYDLYVRFRPAIAAGRQGWGQKGVLHISQILDLIVAPPPSQPILLQADATTPS